MIIHVRPMMFGFALTLGLLACSSKDESTAAGDQSTGASEKGSTSEEQTPATAKSAAGGDASARPPQREAGAPSQVPAAAVEACAGQAAEAECSFALDGGALTGTCTTTPAGELACLPAGGPPPSP